MSNVNANEIAIIYNLDNFFTETEINIIYKEVLSKNNIELITLDSGNSIQASFEDLKNIITVIVPGALIASISNQIFPNAVWDAIKLVITSIYRKVKDKKCYRVTSNSTKEIPITLGIKVKIKEAQFNFKLDNISDETIVQVALDKFLEFVSRYDNKGQDSYMEYLAQYENSEWEIKDMYELIQEKVSEKEM